jgi:hypothetical protein
VFVNRLYLLADFAFWLGLVVLASFTAGQFLKKESKRDSSRTTEKSGHPETRRALISLVPVFLVLVFGLVAVPVIISSSGIVVPNGTSFVVPSNGQYLNLPFDVGHLSRLSGDLQASRPVDVYVLNSSQFTSFVETGCLSPGPPVIENLTSGTFSTPVPAGSYNLIACLSTDTSDVSVEFTHLDLVPGMHP